MPIKNMNKYLFKPQIQILITSISIAYFSLISCINKDVREGEKLAKIYCASCHTYPSPSFLTTNVWKLSTLPYMGIMMGVSNEIKNLPEPLKAYEILKPESQLISNEDWTKIKEFYIEKSPDKLDFENEQSLGNIDNLFKKQLVNTMPDNTTIPNFTVTTIDTVNHQIMAGDQSNRFFWVVDSSGKVLQNNKNQDAISCIDLGKAKNNNYYFTYMGKTTQANLEAAGSITRLLIEGKSIVKNNTLASNLNRPVSSLFINLDSDPSKEILVCEFGFRTAGLSLWKKIQKTIIKKST